MKHRSCRRYILFCLVFITISSLADSVWTDQKIIQVYEDSVMGDALSFWTGAYRIRENLEYFYENQTEQTALWSVHGEFSTLQCSFYDLLQYHDHVAILFAHTQEEAFPLEGPMVWKLSERFRVDEAIVEQACRSFPEPFDSERLEYIRSEAHTLLSSVYQSGLPNAETPEEVTAAFRKFIYIMSET